MRQELLAAVFAITVGLVMIIVSAAAYRAGERKGRVRGYDDGVLSGRTEVARAYAAEMAAIGVGPEDFGSLGADDLGLLGRGAGVAYDTTPIGRNRPWPMRRVLRWLKTNLRRPTLAVGDLTEMCLPGEPVGRAW